MAPFDLRSFSVQELLGLFSEILDELKRRGVVRTDNNPAADYAEHLAAAGLSLDLADRSNRGFDALDADGQRYEVKARRWTRVSPPPHFSVIRGLEARRFDYFVGIVLNQDFTVYRACLMPHEMVTDVARYVKHTNGWRVRIYDGLWELDGVVDITERLREAQRQL